LAIRDYIHDRNPESAVRVGARIRESVELLRFFPYAGRLGRVAGTREWVVRGLPYVIVYEVTAGEPGDVMILGVFHGAQNRDDPGALAPR
jgi:plasmid stabilization system protein ParE